MSAVGISGSSEPKIWAHSRQLKTRLRLPLERLCTAQLRYGSVYYNLRTLVPVFVLGGTWLWIMRGLDHASFRQIYGISVTVRHLVLASLIALVWNLWLSLSPFENQPLRESIRCEVSRLTSVSLLASLPLLVSNLLRGLFVQGLELAGLTAFSLMVVSVVLLNLFVLAAILSPRLSRKKVALIVGTGGRSELLKRKLCTRYSQYEFYGCIDNTYFGDEAGRKNYLGQLDKLPMLLKEHPIEIVLIGLPVKSKYDEIQEVIRVCESVGVASHYMSDIFATTGVTQLSHAASHDFSVISATPTHPRHILKRAFDIVAASMILMLVSPIMIMAALAIRLTSKGSVLFVQQRYGLHRKRFPMFKFRSMVVNAEKLQVELEAQNEAAGPVFKMKKDPRVTPVGAFLRKTSIDELPQLFNVIRGEMSLVGPRPLPLRDVTRFDESWLLRRFSVRPGITCLWQISGRSNTSFDFWIRQDLAYIDQWTLWLDFSILLKTIPAVLYGRGAV